ncbi:hypothetical protein KUTeg_008239 [Tegillarca granosa]|uniref:Ankyrin repeat domain-containing protein n=1 Tax=Tegillarca granosa TaxID=220873 RepID=A0ABQ9FDF4_TEGGR|nr:hypothetical protein KUTeg_008239 [Tegillarca granosa]
MMDKEEKLHTAVRECDSSTVKSLINSGVNINCQFYGWTPLQLAINSGHEEIAELLIEKGCDLCFHDNKSISPFEDALYRELTKHGCDVNVQDSDNWTALWYAYSNSNDKIMKLLLTSGADKHCRNSEGKTILDEAKASEDEHVIEMLQNFSTSWT